MTDSEASDTSAPSARAKRGLAADAAREEQHLRQRWESTQESLRERFDEPISRATRITQRTLAWFPVRVWRNFLQHEGFLLAAGISYQTLFAAFAAIYVVFAIVGIWLGGSEEAVDALVDIINAYIPGLISDNGIATQAQVQEIANSMSGTLGITGAIAVGALLWTAIGAISFARRAVRGVFGIAPDRRNYFLLKSLDLLAAIVFGAGLLVGTALGALGTWALTIVFDLVGMQDSSFLLQTGVWIVGVSVLYAVNTALMAGLFRFLTGTRLTWRRIVPGSLVGAAATTLLQLGFGLFLSYSPSNPLLVTFTVFIVLLLWFRLIGIVLLVAASWIAVAAHDNHVPLIPQTEAQRLAKEHQALLLAAQVRLRTAQDDRESAPWYRRWAADRAVRDAEDELQQVKDAAPPPPQKRGLLAPAAPKGDAAGGDVRPRR
ncbi:YihY/virulence factor BrkB family protein [Microbacterium bovistercoris]|uniref:YihY/virulence factor BrkB family protein n=1 Tax=Microbacterium bovistercoris TaxID=2293570 RepID=UPI001FE5C587|nr:YihY/virulence factor BrkB family protein [Microbacterium bovistercoris]